jgi:2-C-methyl-D-erythritol 4-phosphate cytidylyltransferase
MRYYLVIPAAGSGRRLAATLPKQYAELGGKTVIELALAPFEADADCAGIVVAIAGHDATWPAIAARRPRAIEVAAGGAERAHSVQSALHTLATRARADDWVMVHDAARPCFAPADLQRLKQELSGDEVGGLLAVPLADTLKRGAAEVDKPFVESTIERAGLWRAATPQVFRLGLLRDALDAALAAGRLPTDEAQAMEWAGHAPRLIAGRTDNIKVTTADDLALARAIIASRKAVEV